MKVFLTIALLSFTAALAAQSCEPDTLYRDSMAGVYPRPLSDMNPNGGIDTFACIGQPFEFVFTVIIPDTFTFNGLMLTLLSAKIEENGAVTGLPSGLDYDCFPPDCIFPADSIGCLVLQGIPESGNAPGDYEPVIEMTINTNIFPITTTFPGPIFPGKYVLELRDENCLPVNTFTYATPDQWKAFPNPVIDQFNFSFVSPKMERHVFVLTDLSGRILLEHSWTSSGWDQQTIDLSTYDNGMYLYSLRSGEKSVSGRIVKNE